VATRDRVRELAGERTDDGRAEVVRGWIAAMVPADDQVRTEQESR